MDEWSEFGGGPNRWILKGVCRERGQEGHSDNIGQMRCQITRTVKENPDLYFNLTCDLALSRGHRSKFENYWNIRKWGVKLLVRTKRVQIHNFQSLFTVHFYNGLF